MKSQLKLHTSFDECEAENLTQHLRVQAPCQVVVFNEACEVLGYSDDLSEETLASVAALASTLDWPSEPRCISIDGYTALAHRAAGLSVIELAPKDKSAPIPASIELPEPSNNIHRWGQSLCELLKGILGYSRVMVYRFSEDYSGEVLAEAREPNLDPFLGLHYPATDIPSQARALYRDNKARIIYSAVHGDTLIKASGGVNIDQTLISCRGVSPYHLKYLANMGSRATASIALNHDGRLWGLISMHRIDAPPPNLELYPLLRTLSDQLSEQLTTVLALEAEARKRRSEQLLDRFNHQLEEEFDVVPALMLSNHALHRLTGGVGAVLVAGDIVTQVGMTPTDEVSLKLVEKHREAGETLALCSDVSQLKRELAMPGFGGYAYLQLGVTPPAALIIYRREVAQTVAWGGDPRHENHLTSSEGEMRYTPRASFDRWVETVSGRCVEWDNSTRQTLAHTVTALAERFGGGSSENLGLLLAYSATQLSNGRDRIRTRLAEQFERLQQSIAIAIEDESSGGARVLGINEAAAEAFNIPAREAESMSMEAFTESTLVPFDQFNFDKPAQISVWTHDQGNRDLEITVERHLDFSNQRTGKSLRILVYRMSDVTEARRVELALQAAYLRTQRQAEVQSQVISQLMHELRTPLNSIIGFSSFLRDSNFDGVQKDDFIERIARNADLLKQIIDQSDQQQRTLRQQISEQAEYVDLQKEVARVVSDLQLMATENGIAIELNLPSTACPAQLPRNVIDQVLINIVGNSIKYSHSGSLVKISVRCDDEYATVEVEDSGVGMTPEQVADCTLPFKRFSEKTGSGLGLSIVKQLVTAHAGTLDIKSSLGKGTQVTVHFPLSQRPT